MHSYHPQGHQLMPNAKTHKKKFNPPSCLASQFRPHLTILGADDAYFLPWGDAKGSIKSSYVVV